MCEEIPSILDILSFLNFPEPPLQSRDEISDKSHDEIYKNVSEHETNDNISEKTFDKSEPKDNITEK